MSSRGLAVGRFPVETATPGGRELPGHRRMAPLSPADGSRRSRRDPPMVPSPCTEPKPCAVPCVRPGGAVRNRSAGGPSAAAALPARCRAPVRSPSCSLVSQLEPFVLRTAASRSGGATPSRRGGPFAPARGSSLSGRPAGGPPFLLAWEISTPADRRCARGSLKKLLDSFSLCRNGFRPVDEVVHNQGKSLWATPSDLCTNGAQLPQSCGSSRAARKATEGVTLRVGRSFLGRVRP
jgi:hypothetical protein